MLNRNSTYLEMKWILYIYNIAKKEWQSLIFQKIRNIYWQTYYHTYDLSNDL